MALVDDYARVDLTKYRETMYVSKNKDLKQLVGELQQGKFTKNPILSQLLMDKTKARYKEFDEHLLEAEKYKWPGVQTFFNTLQQLLYLKYFAPEQERLPRDRFQNAMGIMQARWAIHPNNCRPKDVRLEIVQFRYWEDLTPEVQTEIVKKLVEMIGMRMYDVGGNSQQEKKGKISNILKGTVWYAVSTTISPEMSDNTKEFSAFSVPSNCFRFFPLPETIRQFSMISCIYVPELVFGTLSSGTLFKHIALYECRPYVCHMPNSKSNLCSVHATSVDIFRTWFHDFVHSSMDDCTDVLPVVNSMLGPPYCDMPAFESMEAFRTQLEDPKSKLNSCIQHQLGVQPEGHEDDLISRMNDVGVTFGKVPSWGGARLRLQKKSRRSKRKRGRTRRRGSS